MNLTTKQLYKLTTSAEWARARARENAKTARYWARNARLDLKRGDREEAFKSLLIAFYDRYLARSWRAEVQRLVNAGLELQKKGRARA